SESLAGEAKLPEFHAAYARLIERLKRPRMVIVSPTMFEEAQLQSSQLAARLKSNNKALFAYNNELAKMAADRRLEFVDVAIPQGFLVLLGVDDFTGKWTPPLEPVISREGQHISTTGRSFVDGAIVSTLGLRSTALDIEQSNEKRLIELIRTKNRLWARY